jgi:hypothetical protein
LLPLEIDPLKILIKGFLRDPLGYSIIKRAKKIRPNIVEAQYYLPPPLTVGQNLH